MMHARSALGGDGNFFSIATADPLETAMMTIATTAPSAAPEFVTSANPATMDDASPGECSLLGPFAILVQAALGGLALLALVYKRWRERPQRPVKIWFFDASKQVFGSVLVHVANIFMSMLTSGSLDLSNHAAAAAAAAAAVSVTTRGEKPYVPNPCSFYLLNLAIDTTIGIPILILLLRVFTYLVSLTPLGKPRESIQSGHYGTPPSSWWWLKQSMIYFLGLFGMKVCVLAIFILFPFISKAGDWALGWTEGNEKLQIAFVMMIFPLIMNALQYYIIDSFIKEKDGSSHKADYQGHERVPTEDPDEEDGRADQQSGLLQGRDVNGREHAAKLKTGLAADSQEYDPAVDGDARTVTGSSSHRSLKDPAPELYPKE